MESVKDLLRRLEQLNSIGTALSRERDTTRLLESILLAAKTITHADGGTLYRMAEDGRALRFEIMRTDSMHVEMGAVRATPSTSRTCRCTPKRVTTTTPWSQPTRHCTSRRSTLPTPTPRPISTSPAPAVLMPAPATAPSRFCLCP